MKTEQPHLSIFETFKTKKEQLTGEAIRQRSIIAHLAKEDNSALMTRTAIAQKLAKKDGLLWKNIYSGIFRDLVEVLIPLDIVTESGRLPLKRGPKALQEKGIPCYQLTTRGLLAALSISELENRRSTLNEFLSKDEIDDSTLTGAIKILEKISPKFVHFIFEAYVRAYCDGKFEDLLPFSVSQIGKISHDSFLIQRELLEGFTSLPKPKKTKILKLFSKFETV